MRHGVQRSRDLDIGTLVKERLEENSALITNASREQKQWLVMALEELLPNNESMLNFWIQLLIKNKNICKYINEAPEAAQCRLLLLVEDLEGSD